MFFKKRFFLIFLLLPIIVNIQSKNNVQKINLIPKIFVDNDREYYENEYNKLSLFRDVESACNLLLKRVNQKLLTIFNQKNKHFMNN